MTKRPSHRAGVAAACLIALGVASVPVSTVLAGEAAMVRRQIEYPLEHRFNLVKQVQTVLVDKGYDPGPVDGRYGPRTRAALASYQRDHALSGDGHVTEETVRHLGLR